MALLVIIIITVIAAYAISARAAAKWYFGGQVTYFVPGCTMAIPVPKICPDAFIPCLCPNCGCVKAPCIPPPPKWAETGIRPFGGGKTYSCEPVAYSYIFSPMSPPPPNPLYYILGGGQNAKTPFKIGLWPLTPPIPAAPKTQRPNTGQ